MRTIRADLLKGFHIASGILCAAAGLVLLPLPIPLGLPLLALALALLLPYFPPLQRTILRARSRHPRFDETLRNHRQHCPRHVRAGIDKTCPHTLQIED